MGRNIALSVIFLITMGGAGFALPDWLGIYNIYGSPSSGALATATDADIRTASRLFGAMPNGGFGPPTTSFQNQNGHFSVVEPRPALQFKDRWLFDYASGAHHPHHQKHHRRLWVRGAGQWSFIPARNCHRCPANVRPAA